MKKGPVFLTNRLQVKILSVSEVVKLFLFVTANTVKLCCTKNPDRNIRIWIICQL